MYLPPAYFADNAEPLPVIVLSAGQPGSPDNCLSGDRIQNVMNDFAAAHKGIAPVVVIPDTLGSDLANPICADTVFGKVDTYLANGEQLHVYAAAKAAGMEVQQWESPGTGHDWDTATAGVAHTLPWLAGRMNLTA